MSEITRLCCKERLSPSTVYAGTMRMGSGHERTVALEMNEREQSRTAGLARELSPSKYCAANPSVVYSAVYASCTVRLHTAGRPKTFPLRAQKRRGSHADVDVEAYEVRLTSRSGILRTEAIDEWWVFHRLTLGLRSPP